MKSKNFRSKRSLARAIDRIAEIHDPSRIITELEDNILMHVESTIESDGVIHDPGAIETIGCLKAALEMVQLKKAYLESAPSAKSAVQNHSAIRNPQSAITL